MSPHAQPRVAAHPDTGRITLYQKGGEGMSIAVVPVKPFSAAKRRLSPACTDQERQALCQAFLWDLLEKLCASELFDAVCAVGTQPGLPDWLSARGLSVLTLADAADRSLNDAFSLAVRRFSRQHDSMLFLHGDLPLVQPGDFRQLMEPLAQVKVVLAADRHGEGTNAVAARLPTLLTPQFGAGSICAHQTCCLEKGIPHRLVYHERFGFDVDRPCDLQALCARVSPEAQPHTWQALTAISRLSAPRPTAKGGPT